MYIKDVIIPWVSLLQECLYKNFHTLPVISICLFPQIDDLSNVSAIQTVEQALLATDGVLTVSITSAGQARIEFDNTVVGPRDLLRVVQVCGDIVLWDTFILHFISRFAVTSPEDTWNIPHLFHSL